MMYILTKGLRVEGTLSLKRVEMLHKLASGMYTAAVAESHRVI